MNRVAQPRTLVALAVAAGLATIACTGTMKGGGGSPSATPIETKPGSGPGIDPDG